MAALSIGKAWEETVDFVKREGHLLFPVAFLFMALPMAIWPYLIPPEWQTMKLDAGARTLPPVPPLMGLGFLAMMLVTAFGSLAIYALALRPGISVGEALGMALKRVPVLLAAVLALTGVVMLVGLTTIILVAIFTLISPWLGLLLGSLSWLAAIACFAYGGVRLILLNPVLLDRDTGSIASIRTAWSLTRGHFWRLLSFGALFILVVLVTSSAAQVIFGIIGRLIGGANGALLVGGLASAILSTITNVYLLVMLSRLYRQLQPSGLGDIFR